MQPPPFHSNGTRCFINERGERVCTGSQIGRSDNVPPDAGTVRRLRLVRVRPVDGDYDKGGAYWGGLAESPLYCAWGESDTEQAVLYFRAPDRAAAKVAALRRFPAAKFFRSTITERCQLTKHGKQKHENQSQ